jgi:heptosyltransferase-2
MLLTNSFRSALLTYMAGIKRRVGYDRNGRGLLLTDKLLADKCNGKYVAVPMTRYYNAVARYLGARDLPAWPEVFTTPEEEAVVQGLFDEHGIRNGRPVVVINPGASFGSAKCWLPDRFGRVADALMDDLDAAVFVSCGPKERDVAREVSASMKREPIVLDRPLISLGPLKALVRRCDLLVTNDTGPRHFGVAFGVPIVTLFGSTDPKWTETGYPNERQLMVKVSCGPCMKRVCPLDHRCMTRITAEMVLEAARELLSQRLASTESR